MAVQQHRLQSGASLESRDLAIRIVTDAGSQRHVIVLPRGLHLRWQATQACTFKPSASADSLPIGACHRPLGVVHAPFLWSITMSLDLDTTTADATPVQGELLDAESNPLTLSLQDFVAELATNCSTPSTAPIRRSIPARQAHRQLIVASLKRKLFPARPKSSTPCRVADRPRRTRRDRQRRDGLRKTTVGIATAVVLNAEGYRRTLVLSPPHLVYKWRRGDPGDGGGREGLGAQRPGYAGQAHQSCASSWACHHGPGSSSSWAACGCGWVSLEARLHHAAHPPRRRGSMPGLRHGHHRPRRRAGQPGRARSRGVPQEVQPLRRTLWTLIRPRSLSGSDQSSAVLKALKRIPTIGEVTAQKLMQKFGDGFLASMLGDNIHEFINLMDAATASWCFPTVKPRAWNDAMANMEFGFGEGGYQPSEFIKRYLPQGTFDLLIADEATSTRTAAVPGPGHGRARGEGAQDLAADRHADGRLWR